MAYFFPKQKVSTNAKTRKWGISCIESALNYTSYDENTSLRQTFFKKQINYDLANGILNESDVKEIVNPWGLSGEGMSTTLQDYPLSKPRINLLVGESIKRKFNPVARLVNDDAISEKEADIKKTLIDKILALADNPNFDEIEAKDKLRGMDKWKNFEAQDIRERMATQILQYFYKQQTLDEKFMGGFEDALICAEEIYCVDEIAGEVVVRKCSPLNIRTIRSGDSPYIEDSDVIIEEGYYPIGQALDFYYDYLKSSDIDKLEEHQQSGGDDSGLVNYQNNFPLIPAGAITSTDANIWGFSGFTFTGSASVDRLSEGPFDESGNVRISRVVWKSMRKVGKKIYYDEDGIQQFDLVDENYVPDKAIGENVRWIWISEWWEGTRIAEDIFVKVQPRPVQFRRMNNLSAGGSGYVGTIYNVDIGKAQSILDLMKPYQYLYDEFMFRIKKAFQRFKMPQIEVDLAKIPEDWDTELWLYYAEEIGYQFINSFNEGSKGQATGKLAGSFNTTGKLYNPDMGNYIQQHVLMLQYIEQQIGAISGITSQRLGQIDNRETVGGVERSVFQSSHITEKLFKLHENTKLRVLESIVETTKYVWRNNKSKRMQYITDDLSTHILEIDGRQFNEGEYGVFASNSSNDNELRQDLKLLAHALIQNDRMSISQLMDIYLSDNISSMRRKIETGETEAMERQKESESKALEAKKAELAVIEKRDRDKLALEESINVRDNATKIEIKRLEVANSKSKET